jgi:hypothetical protein
MPRIRRFPFFGKRFFRRIRKMIGSSHYGHFWRLVVVLAAMTGRRSLQRIEEVLGKHRTRQAIAFFLTRAEWDAPELLREKALDTLRELGWKAGETAYILLDDTQKRKRGKRMAAVSKLFLHAERVYARGHTIVGCVLAYRGVVIPYAVRLWASEDYCKGPQELAPGEPRVEFRKITELGADMVRQVTFPSPGQGIVLFDCYYLCPAVISACKDREFPYIGAAKKNRNFFPDGRDRDKRKLGSYGANVLHKDGQEATVDGKKYRLAERVGRLSKAGRVKLVFSRRPRERSWIALATNYLSWGKKKVLSHYLTRWGIEVFWKMSKQYLGLGDYQVLRYRAVERYLHLVLIAHILLTHLALTESDAKAEIKTTRHKLRLSSVPQLQEKIRELLWKDVLQSIPKRCSSRTIARKIKEFVHL